MIAAIAALASAVFAVATWRLSRAQFQLFWPFVEVDYRRLLNGHLIEFSKGGQQHAEWELAEVSVKGGKCAIASYKTLSWPDKGLGFAGHIRAGGRKVISPPSRFLIVNEEGPVEVKLTFTFRSKSSASLRHRVHHRLSLRPLPPGTATEVKKDQLFSGEIEVNF